MIPLIEQHLDEVAAVCRKYGVVRLELFGSAAKGTFDAAQSDLDFFVEFKPASWKGSFRRFMGLKLELEELFARSVDLVEPKAITNPYFAVVANRYREVVFNAA
jgi:predicted nucleotidyltransferase